MKLSTLNRELAAGHRRAFELESELAAIYARQFRRLALTASARFVELAHPRAMTAAGDGTPANPNPGDTPAWLPPDVDELLNRPLFDAESAAAAQRVHKKALARALPTVKRTPEIALDVESPFAKPLLEKVATKSVNMGLAARDVIVKIIGDAYSNGLSVPDAALELRRGIDHLSQTTALMQARTDLNGIANGASLASVAVLGEDAPAFKQWQATYDDRTRETHADADGQIVPLDQPFTVGDDLLMYPGDPSGSDGETINCRCTILYTDSAGAETGGDEMGDITAAGSAPVEITEERIDELVAAATAGETIDNMLEALLAAALTGAPVKWRAVLAREGEITADGRVIDPGALSWRPLPLTLMAMIVNSESGHAGSEVAGRIDRIYRDGFDIVGEGIFDVGEYGATIAELVRTRTLRGVSVDIAPEEIEFRPKPGAVQEYDDEGEPYDLPEIMAVTKGLLLGATVCPFQAIGSATIEVVASESSSFHVLRFTTELALVEVEINVEAGGESEMPEADDEGEAEGDDGAGYGGAAVLLYPDAVEAAALAMPDGEPADSLHITLAYCPGAQASELADVVADLASRCSEMAGEVTGCGAFADSKGDGHPCFAIPNVYGLAALRTDLCRALEAAGVPVASSFDFAPHITLGYSKDGPMMPPHDGRVGCSLSFRALTLSSSAGDRVDYPLGGVELTAAAAGLAPVLPPRAWFENPKLDGPTPLTVTDDGRVFGHVAVFNQCHIGNPAGPGVCVTAPKSPTGYSNFHLGELVTAEGDAIAVGQLTIDTGHAPLGTTPRQAVAHYDNTGTVAAHVRCGEDRFGIWFAGAVCPDISESMLRKFRGAKISGDWRKVNGRIDMIGAHCVNIPGFPIPRPQARIVASAAFGELDELELESAGDGLLALVAAGIVGEAPRTPEQIAARIATLAARAEGRDALVAAGLGEDA